MTLDEQIEFYHQQYLAAVSRSMALVAFGAYTALVKFKEDLCTSSLTSR